MQAIKKVICLFFIIQVFIACGSDSSKSGKDSETTSVEHSESVLAKIKYNKLDLKDLNLKIEVIYKIDENIGLYEEWVKQKHNDIEKTTYFKFNFSTENYKAFKLNEANYYKTFKEENRAIQISEQQIQSLNMRFKNEVPVNVFESLKTTYLAENSDPDAINVYDNPCHNDWEEIRQTVVDYYNMRFQQCYFSKYSELAQEDARQFLKNNRYLSYLRLFGLDLVYPQIATYLEINTDGDKFLSLGTAYSPRSYFVRSDINKVVGEECKGHFVSKNADDLDDGNNLFVGGHKDPAFIDAHYFIRACFRQYQQSKPFIGSEIINLYPNTSQFFKEEVARNVIKSFNIEPIDKKISEDLDLEIEKYNFLLKNYNESSSAEIYENWKKIQMKEYQVAFEAYLPVGSFDDAKDDYDFLKFVISNPNSRLRYFKDKPDLYLSEDEKAVLDIEKYILLVDILKE